MKDKGLFFLVLSFSCIWLVLDQVYGNKLITQFVENILPSSSKTTNTKSVEDLREDENGNITESTVGNTAGYKG